MKLDGNTILITGGGSGIGKGLAEALHARGNQVIIAGRRQANLDETVAANPGMDSVILDIEDPASIRSAAEQVVARHPKLNVLINNAGIMRVDDLSAGINEADMVATVNTNFYGPVRLTAALIEHLKAQPRAAVVTVTSGLAFVPLVMTPVYCATKAAIHSYTESLRYALKHTSVEVLEIVPPYVQTDLLYGKNDPAAMPLDEYIAETIEILATADREVVSARSTAMRTAEATGKFDAIFNGFNDARMAAMRQQQAPEEQREPEAEPVR